MKNSKFLRHIVLLLTAIVTFNSCQELVRPEFSDFPLDGPMVTLVSPNPNGTTVIQSVDPVTSITIQFSATDDIAISNILVQVDGNEVANLTEFANPKSVEVDELVYNNVNTGTHTFTLTVTDSDDNVEVVTTTFVKEDTPPYNPQFDGEIFYMGFEGKFTNLVTNNDATVVGNPTFSTNAKVGEKAYAGAPDSYLTVPTSGLLGTEFSASFWMNVNATPDRAGILVIGPEDTANPSSQNNRSKGFRFFRENAGGMQRLKLNVGTGSGDSWFDGGAAADVAPGEWNHVAFTISGTQATVYINGVVVRQGALSGVDWTGCDIMSIMSGAPRFTGWNHLSDSSLMDELRLFNIELSQQDIQKQIAMTSQKFYMSFDSSFNDDISTTAATVVGNPTITTSAYAGGGAYDGAEDSYLTFPTEGLLGEEFTASFWMNVDGTPDRAGILVIAEEDTANPNAQNNRSKGFRFFRENAGGMQRFKLNVGRGSADSWFDGGSAADVPPNTNSWTHFAFTISNSECVVYINGEIVRQGAFTGVDWTGCNVMSIMSGAPRFAGWNHLSDRSQMDELRIFDKALSQDEIKAIMN